MNDTIHEHIADMRVDALEDLSKQLQENFEKFSKDLAVNLDSNVQIINDVSVALKGTLENTNTILDDFLKTYNKNLTLESVGLHNLTKDDINISKKAPLEAAEGITHYNDNLSQTEYEYYQEVRQHQADIAKDTSTIAEILKGVPGHAHGTKSAKGGLTKVNEYGPEAIVTDTGIFLPLQPGDGVIPNTLTENLFQLAQNGMAKAQPSVIPEIITNTNLSNNMQVGNLLNINVEGNLDSSVIPQIDAIAKGLQSNRDFMSGIYKSTAKMMSQDLRKAR